MVLGAQCGQHCIMAPSISSSARVAARRLAAGEVIQVQVHLPTLLDGLRCVEAESLADGVGDDPKALPELVDETDALLHRAELQGEPAQLAGARRAGRGGRAGDEHGRRGQGRRRAIPEERDGVRVLPARAELRASS